MPYNTYAGQLSRNKSRCAARSTGCELQTLALSPQEANGAYLPVLECRPNVFHLKVLRLARCEVIELCYFAFTLAFARSVTPVGFVRAEEDRTSPSDNLHGGTSKAHALLRHMTYARSSGVRKDAVTGKSTRTDGKTH